MFDNHLTIKIANSTGTPLNWVAFGYNEGLKNPPGVSVEVSQSSLDQTTRSSANNGFVITEIKVNTSSNDQMDNNISIRNSEMTGSGSDQSFTPSAYSEPSDKSKNFIKIENPGIKINGKSSLGGTINANTTMLLMLEIKPESKMSSFVSSILSLFRPGNKVTITGNFPR